MRYFLATDPDGTLVIEPELGLSRTIGSTSDLDALLAESLDPRSIEVWTWDCSSSAFTLLTCLAMDNGRRRLPDGWPEFLRSLRQWHDQLGRPAVARKPRTDDPYIVAQWTRAVYSELRYVCRRLLTFDGVDRDVVRAYLWDETRKARLDERERCAQIADGLGGRLDLTLTLGPRQMAREIAGQIRTRS